MTLSKSGAKNIFDCAIAANAEYIVTNDKHFDVLKNYYHNDARYSVAVITGS